MSLISSRYHSYENVPITCNYYEQESYYLNSYIVQWNLVITTDLSQTDIHHNNEIYR